MTLKTYLEMLGFTAKPCSSADGGEYSSGCPDCGSGGKGNKSDRFHIWPSKENKGGLCLGRFWCRKCSIFGDSIEFLERFHGMDFLEACDTLGVVLPNKSGGYKRKRWQPTPVQAPEAEGWEPRDYGQPLPLWREKGGNFLEDCKERLLGSKEYLAWLAKRGISAEVARAYNLGYNLSSRGGDRYRPRKTWGLAPKQHQVKEKKMWMPQGWVIAAFSGDDKLIQLRVRRRDEDIKKFAENIKYLPLDGSSMATMILHPEAEIFAIVECGFDAILIASLMNGKVGAITTWNSSARPDVHADKILRSSSLILNLLDYDEAGGEQQEWWAEHYSQNIRPPAPPSGNDPGEAFEQGVDIKAWLIASLPRGLKIKLGYAETVVNPKQITKPVPTRPEDEQVVVYDYTLSNGFVIKLTDDQYEYEQLQRAGEPVFKKREIADVKTATSGMSDEERIAAVMLIIDTKTMHKGTVARGEKL